MPENGVSLGGYIYYIATRPGVERPTDTKLQLAAARRQSETAASLIKDCLDLKELYEYEDYLKNPNRANAIDFIARAAEVCPELIEDRKGYVEYIATRPGAEMISDHGLFTDAGVPVVLDRAARKVSEHEGNIWCHIISGINSGVYDNSEVAEPKEPIALPKKNSLCSVSDKALIHQLCEHPHITKISLCLDRDEAGLAASERIKTKLIGQGYFDTDIQTPYMKDWNEDLLLTKTYGNNIMTMAPEGSKWEISGY